jgi:type II secretory pathway component HofQ
MGISVTRQGGVLRIVMRGVLTKEDFSRFVGEVERLESASVPWPDRFTDLTGLQRIDIGFDDMAGLAQRRREIAVPNALRSAIAARDPVQLGYARMFQTLNDHPQIQVRVFPDEAQALAWLSEDREDAAE